MWLLQIFFIWLHNFLRSPAFKTLSAFDQIMHSFQSVITPAPSVDWAYGQGDCEDHFKRMKDVQKEVAGVIKINSLFNILHILPITYLAWTVTKRHWLLEESIGTMTIENEAFKTIWITFSVALVAFIVGPILSCSLLKRINSSFHPCHDIIAEEIKKEKANQDKEPCWGIFSFCSNFHPMQQF